MDTVLKALNWRGRYQMIQYVTFVVELTCSPMQVLSFLFIGKSSPFSCSKLDLPVPLGNNISTEFSYNTSDEFNLNISVTYGQCSVTVTNQSNQIFTSSCKNGYEYEYPRERSFVTEWDLVCEKSALPEVSQTILSLGLTVGAFLFSGIADRYGRRPVYVGCQLLVFVIGILTAFVPDYTSFLFIRFLHGAALEGVGVMSGIMLLELIPTERRAWGIHASILTWTLGLLLLVCVSYLCRELSWRSTQLVMAAFSCFSLVQYWLIDESIRWLAANNKHEEAERLLRKAAKMNGVDTEKVLRLYRLQEETLFGGLRSVPCDPTANSELDYSERELQVLSEKNLKTPDENSEGKDAFAVTTSPRSQKKCKFEFTAFFTNRTIFIRTIIAMYIWFSDNVIYSGLLILSSSLVDDLYLGFTLSVLMEIPAMIAFFVLIHKNVGRRRLTIGSHLLGGLSLGIAGVLGKIPADASIPWVSSVILVISLIGKFGLTLGFNATWLYTPELFPTTIRSSAFGAAVAAGQAGGMTAPYSITVARHVPWLPDMIFALLCLIIPLVITVLPETGGLELPQRVDDLNVTKASPISQPLDADKSCQNRPPKETDTHL